MAASCPRCYSRNAMLRDGDGFPSCINCGNVDWGDIEKQKSMREVRRRQEPRREPRRLENIA